MKRCGKCKETKSSVDFNVSRHSKDGLQYACKECRAEYHKASWGAGGRTWAARMKRTYGITTEQYDAMFDAQNGLCAICGLPPKGQRLAVDHDHRTGIVRGLLHSGCNQTLGFMHEDIDWFQGATNYLLDPPAIAVLGEHRVPNAPPVRQTDKPKEKK